MNRITQSRLQAIVDRINRITGSPMTPYDLTITQGSRGNIGNYHLSGAYGGVSLHRMVNTGGGVSDVFSCGHVTKRELANLMYAYIQGLNDGGTL